MVPVARLDPAIAKYQEILLDATSLYPDATETLPALLARDDLKVGLISNATSSAQLMYLSLQLDRLFPAPILSCRVGFAKPDAEIYRLACRLAGVDPRRSLFVGDGAARELDGAGAVGMKTVKIRRENLLESFRRGESTNWTYQLNDLRELPSLLEPLAG